MQKEIVYQLSKKYGPPRINLRDAELLDSYGDDSHAQRRISHRLPEHVSRVDLDYYGQVYAFMGFKDLLFYLYPIALEYERDNKLDCIDSFMYSLNRFVPIESSQLPAMDQHALHQGLLWIWKAGPLGFADWIQCPNLQNAIGIAVTWDDLNKEDS